MIRRTWVAVAAVTAIVVGACSPSESPNPSDGASASPGTESPGPSASAAATTIRVQLPGPIDGEFAGYIAAQKLGYFGDENLTVKLVPASDNSAVRPAAYYRPGISGPEFTIADAAPVLGAREHDGSDLVNIAQIFQRSGTVLMTWKKDALSLPCGMKGAKVGLWATPADLELRASLANCDAGQDYTRVEVPPNASPFLGGSVAASEGETYDQVATVLEAINPATNKQYTEDDLAILPPTDRNAALQDGIYSSAAWLAASGHRDIAVGFVRAVVRGWVYCRDHQEDCVQFTVQADTSLGTSHTRWMINEVNALVWPSPDGIGALDPVLWQQTITLATGIGLVTKAPSLSAYDDTIVPDAVSILAGKDLSAPDFKKGTVAVAPGGK